jgi:hypothetical protein
VTPLLPPATASEAGDLAAICNCYALRHQMLAANPRRSVVQRLRDDAVAVEASRLGAAYALTATALSREGSA